MKKIFTTLVVAVATIFTVNAQEVKFGARAGLNFSTLSFSEIISDRANFRTKIDTDFKANFHFGVFTEIGFTNQMFLEVGVAYSQQGSKLKSTESFRLGVSQGKEVYNDSYFSVNMINIPVWLKYDIRGFRPKVGVNLGYLASTETRARTKTEEITTTYKGDGSFDFGLGIGAEYNLPMGLFFDTNFNLALTSLGNNPSAKNRVFQIGIGYKF